jgi:hypothetical protein
MLATSPARPAVAVTLSQPVAETAPELPGRFSLIRVAAALQVALATRRAARSEEHGYWYTVARGM